MDVWLRLRSCQCHGRRSWIGHVPDRRSLHRDLYGYRCLRTGRYHSRHRASDGEPRLRPTAAN
ncbi:MAG TPA: hypothetical protein DD706_20200, partial [Nitrospiraceae bacterium]|nr:hypothetical protein [Nitrospiraceae bacterium]